MLIIDSNERTQEVFIPRNGWPVPEAGLRLYTRNTTDGRDLEWAINEAAASGPFIRLVVGMPEGFNAGEWEYALRYGNDIISRGLLKAEDQAREPGRQYRTDNTCKQYGE